MSRATKLAIAGGAVIAAAHAAREGAARRFMDLRERTVLITGGSRGLGLLMARQCAELGAKAAICARNEAELYRARDELRARGRTRLPYSATSSQTGRWTE